MLNAARYTAPRLLVPSTIALSAYITVQDSQPVLAKDASTPPSSTKVDLKQVKDAIVDLIDKDAELRGDGTGLYGTMIRLAWHASGTYSCIDKDGGSNGGLQRFEPECSWAANAGLGLARDKLEPIKQLFPEISYADLYTYAGVVAVEAAGGPSIPFRLGRTDAEDGSTSPPDGRLPAADKGSFANTAQHIRDIFYRMGFTDAEIVALLGAHAVGRCHTDRSGYWGPWSNAETTFSNEYYRLLLEERWSPKLSHNGTAWSGPDQYEDKTGTLMMLPSDLALITDPIFRKFVEVYAKDEDRFFKDFSSAFAKLLELGVPFPATKAWYQFW